MDGDIQLYLVHLGYYDTGLGQGVFESHADVIVAATSFDEARTKAKAYGLDHGQRVHIDGMLRLDLVDGFDIELRPNAAAKGKTILTSNKDRELAPKPSASV